ncbi:MAG: HAMP domain-containing sensor histidine kinase [Planctomycetota bacterium]
MPDDEEEKRDEEDEKGNPELSDGAEFGEKALLTLGAWGPWADRIIEGGKLGDLDICLDVQAPNDERDRRKNGQYSLSMLSIQATDRLRPAAFLLSTLSIWFQREPGGEDDERASLIDKAWDLAHDEGPGNNVNERLAGLLEQLDSYIVPVANPPRWFALSNDLSGWDAYGERLDPYATRLKSSSLRDWLLWSWILAVAGSSLFVGKIFYAAWRQKVDAKLRRQLADFQHDLTSPLSFVRSEINALGAVSVAQGESARQLANIQEAADEELQHAIDLVDDFSEDVAYQTRTRIAETRHPLLWHDLLEPAIEKVMARGKRESLEVWVSSGPRDKNVRLQIDRTSGRRIVHNLLENAYKYRRGDEVRIRVEANVSRRTIEIDFEDHGRGFSGTGSPKRYFESGVRGESTGDSDGKGLGLAIARDLVEQAGGTIEIKSEAEPTRVTVILPRSKQPTL